MKRPGRLMAEVAPLLNLMQHLSEQIASMNGVLARLAQKDEQVSRLCTVPQVGPPGLLHPRAANTGVIARERFTSSHAFILNVVPLAPKEKT
jgi:hypothetical protein